MKRKKPKPIGSRKPKRPAPAEAEMLSGQHNPGLAFVRRTTPKEPLVIAAGPLATIQRMSRESLSRDANLLHQLGGDCVVRQIASLLHRDISPCDLACGLWCFLAHYAVGILGPRDEPVLPLAVGPLATAIENLGWSPYEALAQKMLTNSYHYMRTEFELQEASFPIIGGMRCPIILGDYWTARRAFTQEFGADECRRIEQFAVWGLAIRCMAYSLLNVLAPDFRPTRALEYLVGWRESPAWFLLSDLDIALKRDNLEHAEQLAADPNILNFRRDDQPLTYAPQEYRPYHVKTDESEWRLIYFVAEALIRSNWQEAEAPNRFVVKTTWSRVKERRNMHEREHIKAAKYGYTIEQYANLDKLVDSPLDALTGKVVKTSSKRRPVALSQLGTTGSDFASIEELLEAIPREMDPKLKAVLELRLKGIQFEKMSGILGCSHHDVKAAQQQWQRLKRHIAERISEMQIPRAPGAGTFVYRESLNGNPQGVLQHMPLDQKFPDGRPAAATPIVSFRPDSFPASQAIRHQQFRP